MPAHNQYGQPLGELLPSWQPRPRPQKTTLLGRSCRLEPLAVTHSDGLYEAWSHAKDCRNWTYLAAEQPSDPESCRTWIRSLEISEDPIFFAVIDATSNRPVGSVSLMRIDRDNGVAEIGWINWSPAMQRSRMSTETINLLLCYLFDVLGYRRCEWKCDSLNSRSRKAALRLGFIYEGTFRQAVVVKGRNRDTSWYAIIGNEWPAIRQAHYSWLADDNFDANGKQRQALSDFFKLHP